MSWLAQQRENHQMNHNGSNGSRFNTGQSLTKSLAPCKLAEVRGQPAAVQNLTAFVTAPYATAMLFHGGTGTGKNATARARRIINSARGKSCNIQSQSVRSRS